jgi:predicted nucleic acid-binding protein
VPGSDQLATRNMADFADLGLELDRPQLVDRLSALAFFQPVKEDHIEAAEVRNSCRRRGVKVGTIDALLIQLCRRNDLTLLTTEQDFHAATKHVEFRLWSAR